MSILTNFPCQNQTLWAFVRFLLSGVSICPGEHMSVNQAHCMLDSLRLLRENETLYVKVGDVGGIQYYYHLKRWEMQDWAVVALGRIMYNAITKLRQCLRPHRMHSMLHTQWRGLSVSVCLVVTAASFAKATEMIEIPLGETYVGQITTIAWVAHRFYLKIHLNDPCAASMRPCHPLLGQQAATQ